LLAVALFTVLPSLAQAEPEPEHITLQLKWTHQFQFAGYYAAIEQGYYRDAGLDVRLREAVPDTNPIHAVIEGEADYGVGTSDLLLDRTEGAPVVVLGVIFQHSAYALIVRADASIRSMKELRGKRIMLDSNGTDIVAMLQREGLPPGSYQHIEHNFKLDDWIKGKVDAVDVYMTDQPFNLSQQGIAYRMFKPINSGVDFYGDNLFTTEQEIRNHPQRVQAFLDASLKGWDYAMHHSDEIISLILKKYSSRHSRKQLRFEANAMQPLLEYETVPTGYMFDSRWGDIVRTYQLLGTLPADFKLQGFLYKPTSIFFTKLWSWRWQVLVGILMLVLMIIVIFVFSLRRAVQQRTVELQDAKQQADQANASKSQFLAAASHDMRQPMQAMRLYLDVLGERLEGSESENRNIICKLRESQANLSEILNSFLDISQLDSGVMQPQMKVFDLQLLLQQIHDQYLPTAKAADLSFLLHTPTTEILVYSDPGFVRGILANLIGNALRYTHRGGLILIVKQTKSKVCLALQDSGSGIAAADQDIIFQEFVQLDNPERDNKQGVGLGLAIASRICRQLGSRIQLRSTPGTGSVFSFELPLALASEQKEESSNVVLERKDLSGMLVFVIDDDVHVRDSLKIMLEQWQCEVKGFVDKDGLLLAIQSIERFPDAILSDYHLPNNTTGIEVIQQLRKLAGQAIPALLLTGDATQSLMKVAVKAGLPMLRKPAEAHKLHLFLDRCRQHQ